MSAASYIGILITFTLIVFGLVDRKNEVLAKLQLIWIWIIIAFNNGGMDYQDNEQIYHLAIRGNFRLLHGDWLSDVLSYIAGRMGLAYWQYNALLSTTVLVVFFLIIKKYTDKISLYLSLFMIFPFAESVIQKRYFLMLMVAFPGVLAVSKKEYIKAFIILILALGLHASAVMLFPIIIMDWLIEKIRWLFPWIIFVEIYLLYYGQKFIINIAGEYSAKFLYYYEVPRISFTAAICYIVMNLLFIVLIISISYGSTSFVRIRRYGELDFVTRLNVFSLVYVPLLLADSVFFRNYRVIMLFNFFTLCQTLDDSKRIRGKKYLCALLYVGMMIGYVLAGYSLDKNGFAGPIDTMFNHNQLLGFLHL